MKIKFLPTGQEIEGDPNKTLLQLCTENNIEIKSICKGVPSCAECRIRIVEGEYNVVPPSKVEMSLIGTNYFIDQRRLSCQVHCYGDITVDLKEQIERSEIQNKKVRGFRSPGQKGSHVESHAKQGTLVLEETSTPQRGSENQKPPRHQANVHGVESIESGHDHLQQTEGLAHEEKKSRGGGRGEGRSQGGGGGGRREARGQGGGNRGEARGQSGGNRGQSEGQAGGNHGETRAQGGGPQQRRDQQPREGGGGGNSRRNRNRNRPKKS